MTTTGPISDNNEGTAMPDSLISALHVGLLGDVDAGRVTVDAATALWLRNNDALSRDGEDALDQLVEWGLMRRPPVYSRDRAASLTEIGRKEMTR